MDPNKLHLLIERDEVWAEARDAMPLFEKFFTTKDTTPEEEGKVGWISIKLIATELYTFRDDIKNISKEVLDLYREEIKSGEIDTLKFGNKELDKLKEKIIEVGKNENTRNEVESNLEKIRKDIENIRLIFLYNLTKYHEVIGDMFMNITAPDSGWSGEFTKEEQGAVARCKIMTYYLLVLKEAEIKSLDGSWFK